MQNSLLYSFFNNIFQLRTTNGDDYRGDLDVAADGKSCMNWADVGISAGIEFISHFSAIIFCLSMINAKNE